MILRTVIALLILLGSFDVYGQTCQEVYGIPELVTPDNNNINDQLVITSINETGWDLSIFSRWGSLIFRNPNYRNEWEGLAPDGTQVKDGIYYYVLTTPDGQSSCKGYFYVLRQSDAGIN